LSHTHKKKKTESNYKNLEYSNTHTKRKQLSNYKNLQTIANPTAKATPTGLLDLEQSNMRPRENQESSSENRPPLGSLIIALACSVITVASFTIVIPTSDSYITSFGGSSTMAGLLVGITPIFSAFAQPFMSFFFKRYKYRSILIVCCLVNIIGCVLYALSSATNWIGTILIGRMISGIVGGPSYIPQHMFRVQPTKRRDHYICNI
jgi:Na+/melibiose symporter-like transporter